MSRFRSGDQKDWQARESPGFRDFPDMFGLPNVPDPFGPPNPPLRSLQDCRGVLEKPAVHPGGSFLPLRHAARQKPRVLEPLIRAVSFLFPEGSFGQQGASGERLTFPGSSRKRGREFLCRFAARFLFPGRQNVSAATGFMPAHRTVSRPGIGRATLAGDGKAPGASCGCQLREAAPGFPSQWDPPDHKTCCPSGRFPGGPGRDCPRPAHSPEYPA